MSTLTAAGASFVKARRDALEGWGDQLLFYIKALAWTPRVLRRYRQEIMNTLAEVVFGVGALSVIAGTVGVIAFLAFFAGTEVGLQGYASLSQIGVAKFTAFIS
ncbi:MAG: transporter permease, partial [Aeromicrobium sp.]|nr:transporter permease [Aeromicrobium sp.]